MAEFQSRLCNVCRNALDQLFKSMTRHEFSGNIPHHLTRESLADSVLAQACHLCRLAVEQLMWPNDMSLSPPENTIGLPPRRQFKALSADDFEASDFDCVNFPNYRLWLRRALGWLPEDFGLVMNIHIDGEFVDALQGNLRLNAEFTYRDLNPSAHFWITSTEGMLFFTPLAEKEVIVSPNSGLSSIHRLSWAPCNRQDNRGHQLPKAGCRMARSVQEGPSCMY
jgi:hypothetical protein